MWCFNEQYVGFGFDIEFGVFYGFVEVGYCDGVGLGDDQCIFGFVCIGYGCDFFSYFLSWDQGFVF